MARKQSKRRKPVGSPFVAVRVPRRLHAAFGKWCRARKLTEQNVLRAYMARVTGVSLKGDNSAE